MELLLMSLSILTGQLLGILIAAAFAGSRD
jgi:hypothetical protein